MAEWWRGHLSAAQTCINYITSLKLGFPMWIRSNTHSVGLLRELWENSIAPVIEMIHIIDGQLHLYCSLSLTPQRSYHNAEYELVNSNVQRRRPKALSVVTDENRSRGFGTVARKPNMFAEIFVVITGEDHFFFPLKKWPTDIWPLVFLFTLSVWIKVDSYCHNRVRCSHLTTEKCMLSHLRNFMVTLSLVFLLISLKPSMGWASSHILHLPVVQIILPHFLPFSTKAVLFCSSSQRPVSLWFCLKGAQMSPSPASIPFFFSIGENNLQMFHSSLVCFLPLLCSAGQEVLVWTSMPFPLQLADRWTV